MKNNQEFLDFDESKDVFEFSDNSLAEIIAENCSSFTESQVKRDITFRYLIKYLSYKNPVKAPDSSGEKIKDSHMAKTFVVERKYLSESFYKNHFYYYSTSF